MFEFFAVYGAIAAAAGVVAALLWLQLSSQQRRQLLPVQSLRDVRWHGGEVALAFLVIWLGVMLTISLLEATGFYLTLYGEEPSALRKVLWSMPMALPFTLALVYYCLFAISETRPGDIGMTRARWRQNIVVGYLVWLLLTPVILGVNALCRLWGEPEPHPFLTFARDNLSQLEWGLFIFQTVAFAAITEELLFRGLLLGWLRRTKFVGHCVLVAIIGIKTAALAFAPLLPPLQNDVPGEAKEKSQTPATRVRPPVADHQFAAKPAGNQPPAAITRTPHSKEIVPGSSKGADKPKYELALFVGVLLSCYLWWAYRLVGGEKRASEHATAKLAIFGSALLFAVVHEVWPSQIPLFLFALALGWLAYRTQSLVGPIIVHGLFNAVACALLISGVG